MRLKDAISINLLKVFLLTRDIFNTLITKFMNGFEINKIVAAIILQFWLFLE